MLPALRRDLDLMPSPVPERPGILIRDPMRYSEAVLILPYSLAAAVECFDGQHSELDLRAVLPPRVVDQLTQALRESGFLEDETFAELKRSREKAFAEAGVREPAHAGSGYPTEREPLEETMRGFSAMRFPKTDERWPLPRRT